MGMKIKKKKKKQHISNVPMFGFMQTELALSCESNITMKSNSIVMHVTRQTFSYINVAVKNACLYLLYKQFYMS